MSKGVSYSTQCTVYSGYQCPVYHLTVLSSMCKCNCSSEVLLENVIPIPTILEDDTLETVVYKDFRLWHLLLMGFASFMAVVICVCCCVRFRIPRTKQEIEADYVRKKITRKFKRQLQLLQNTEMDEMDLKRALDRVRSEFKSDPASLVHSDADSVGSGTGAANDSVFGQPTIGPMGVSIEELIESRHSGFRSKLASFVGFLRPRKGNHQPQEEKPTKMGV